MRRCQFLKSSDHDENSNLIDSKTSKRQTKIVILENFLKKRRVRKKVMVWVWQFLSLSLFVPVSPSLFLWNWHLVTFFIGSPVLFWLVLQRSWSLMENSFRLIGSLKMVSVRFYQIIQIMHILKSPFLEFSHYC